MTRAPERLIKEYLSIGSAIAFLVLFISGIALYTAPPCSVATATGWSFAFMSKDGWEGVHITFAIAFLILAPLHLWYNWKTFTSYFQKKGDNSTRSQSALVVGIIALILFLMAAFHVPPVSWLHDAQEKIKFSWGRGGQGQGGGFRGKGGGQGQKRFYDRPAR